VVGGYGTLEKSQAASDHGFVNSMPFLRPLPKMYYIDKPTSLSERRDDLFAL